MAIENTDAGKLITYTTKKVLCYNCSQIDYEHNMSSREAEKIFRGRGWKKIEGLWICPWCGDPRK